MSSILLGIFLYFRQDLIYKFFYNMQGQETSYADCQYANDYKVHFLLGEGGQANVYLGSKGNNLHALKIYLPGLNKDEAFKREVEFLENLKFPYLINIVDADPNAQIKLKNSAPQKRAMIALEFAEGEMFDFISKQGRFAPQVCRTLFKQLILSIKFLDEKGITHRDLKPQNILFDKDFNLKVSDFGLSTFTEGNNKDGNLYSRVGTEGYKPPEMEQGKYTGLQADIFAAGVILFIMYNGTPPFLSTKPHDRIYKLIKDKNFTKFWSLHQKKKPAGFYPDSFKRLLSEFFSYDSTKRPTFKSLAEDDWMNGECLSQQNLTIYMKERYDRIAAQDETKKKIAEVRKEMFMHEVMQDEADSSNSRADTLKPEVKVFIERFKEYSNINIQQLPQTQKKITYVQKDVGFLLAFLKDFIEESAKNKQTFLQDFMQEITPTQFDMKVNEKDIDLKLAFEVDEEDEEVLKIKGKIYQNDGKVGIDWERVSGNDFWLASVTKALNQRLQVLA